jgi:hypothetical protein
MLMADGSLMSVSLHNKMFPLLNLLFTRDFWLKKILSTPWGLIGLPTMGFPVFSGPKFDRLEA